MDSTRFHSWLSRCHVVFCISLLMAGAGEAQMFFTEVTEEALVEPRFGSRTTAFGDYDNDGHPDMLLTGFSWNPTRHHPISLLHNEGNGKFRDQSHLIQGEIPGIPKGGGAIFGDYDNDGDLDLFIPMGGIFYPLRQRNVLLRNDQGIFRDVALEAGLVDEQPTDNAIWVDYNRDGHIDLIREMSITVGRIHQRRISSTATMETAPLWM